jgi:UDP-N-acetylglucosamine 4,6-dehydratase (inverting)
MFNNKTILITGGTGSFGTAFVKYLLKNFKKIKRLIIFSRDELKQYELSKVLNSTKYPCLRFFLGDIRDLQRLKRAFEGVNYVVHAAALKQVDTAEYNPFEFIKTNVIGSQNIIDSALDSDVEKVIALSTDKAVSPINLYGATKLCADKIFISANQVKGKRRIKFSVVRYGNVMFSRGSVMPNFMERKKMNKKLLLTNKEMTRFNITLGDSIEMVDQCFRIMKGGEIFVPKLKSYRLIDLAKSIDNNFSLKETGVRPGEKIHEEMISLNDSFNTFDLGSIYAIVDKSNATSYNFYKNFKKMKPGMAYNSFDNKPYLTIKELRQLIKKNIPQKIK